ncbi:MAG: DUF1931 domain-containing protein [Nanoarchaeota archaeon]|nr:DUF1931 domain-containing protein [Nanoarchaeota archaeon]MBU1103082.1 DUF1931 domain-containing protein [Nanoarchaeota archaeon]
MTDLIVKSKIKEACKGMSVSADVPERLNLRVENILKDAVERAKANGRRTLQARDL